MEKIILIRHGEVDIQYQKTLLGATEVSLSPAGQQQAGILSRFLPSLKPDHCVASPMKRCLETAKPYIKALGLALETERDLREADFGLWEAKAFEEIAVGYPEEVSAMARFDRTFIFPQGEAMKDFLARIHRAMEKWTRIPAKRLAVFTHAGVIRFAVCQLLGIDPKHHVAFEIPYASIVVIKLLKGKGLLQAVIPVTAMEKGEVSGEK